jgi:hypothetical protein
MIVPQYLFSISVPHNANICELVRCDQSLRLSVVVLMVFQDLENLKLFGKKFF